MEAKKTWSVAFAACLIVMGALVPGVGLQEVFQLHEDVVFGKGGQEQLKLDIAVPTGGKGPYPAIVLVHGGGWKFGSYKDFSRKGIEAVQLVARRGYVAVSPQYRLAPKYRFPSQVHDVKCAVRWLRAHAARYQVDPQRIGAVGFSAGGHLVCMLGVTTPEDGLEGEGDLTVEAKQQSSAVQAVVSFFGPTDLTTGDWEKNVEPLLLDFLGGPLQEKREQYVKASPLTYVRRGRTYPPFLFFHGTADKIVHYDQSVKMHKALGDLGVRSQLVTMEGDGHGWTGEKLAKTVETMLKFFDDTLRQNR
ncbi:MAG: alpha/beta hydrolase [Gemmataceae bacterium]